MRIDEQDIGFYDRGPGVYKFLMESHKRSDYDSVTVAASSVQDAYEKVCERLHHDVDNIVEITYLRRTWRRS